jgi:ribose transport system permease protein
MIPAASSRPVLLALNNAPLLLFALVLAVFGGMSPKFLAGDNLVNILIQTSATGIVATGMTFVLLTAGVDLSVGAIMFVGAAVAGKMMLAGQPLPLALAAMLGVGLVFGAINAVFVTGLRIVAFIVTLAMLFVGRGFALWITETRAMNLPESFLQLGSARLKWLPDSWQKALADGLALVSRPLHEFTRPLLEGIPVPVLIFALVVVVAHLVLSRTPFGRQIYALGNSPENARKAGVRADRLLFTVYVISGFCAALGGIISLAQLGAVSPKFGLDYEFKAIAAAVLGGTSLFGGRGRVFPGTVLGAVLIQSVENGLNILNADPYLYPLITSAIIFVAVLLDSARNHLLATLSRRRIRMETTGVP